MVSLSPKRSSPSSRYSSSLLRQSPTHRSSSASSASHFFKEDKNDEEDVQQQRRCNNNSSSSSNRENHNKSSSTLLMYPRVSNPNSNNTTAVTPSRKVNGVGTRSTTANATATEESSKNNDTGTGFLFLPRMYNKSASFSPSSNTTTTTYKSVMSRFRKMKSAPSCTNNATAPTTSSSTAGNGNPTTTTKGTTTTTVDLLFPTTNTNTIRNTSTAAKDYKNFGDENTRHAMMELATHTRNMTFKELEMPSMMDGDGDKTPSNNHVLVTGDAPPPAPDCHTTPPTTNSKIPPTSSMQFKTPPPSALMKKGSAAAGSSTESGTFKKWPGSEGSITSAQSFQSPIQHQSPSLAGCSVLALQRDISTTKKYDSSSARKGPGTTTLIETNDAATFARKCQSFDDHQHLMGASTTPRSVRAPFVANQNSNTHHPHTSRVTANEAVEKGEHHNPKRSASSGHLAPSLAGCSVLAMTNKAGRRNSQTNSFKHTLRRGLTRLSSSFDSNDERNNKEEHQGPHGDDPLPSEGIQHKGRKNKAEKGGTNRHHKNHDTAHNRKMDRRGSHDSYQGTIHNKNNKKQGHSKKSSNHNNKSQPAMHQRRRSSCPDLAAAAADAIEGLEAVYTKEEEDESKEYSDGEVSDYYVEDNDACFSSKNAVTDLTLLIQEEQWDALRFYAGTKQGMRDLRNQLQMSLQTAAADVEEQVNTNSGSATSSDNLLQMALTFDPPKEFIELIRMECPSITHIVNAQGQTPLHIAAAWGASSEVMQTLIQWAPHHVMALDPQGNTPMHLLCGVGWPYLQEEAVGAVDLQERRQKFEQALALMIQVCPQSVSLSNTEGITPLQYLPAVQASEWICRSLTSQVMQAKQVLLMKANAQAQATLEAKRQELEEMRLLQIQRYYQEQQQQQQLPPRLDPYPNNGDED